MNLIIEIVHGGPARVAAIDLAEAHRTHFEDLGPWVLGPGAEAYRALLALAVATDI